MSGWRGPATGSASPPLHMLISEVSRATVGQSVRGVECWNTCLLVVPCCSVIPDRRGGQKGEGGGHLGAHPPLSNCMEGLW